MKGILYYPAYLLIWLITLLPLSILYVLSDILFLLLFFVVRYRRSVVKKNLENAFPDKSHREIRRLARRFYRYLADYFIESVYPLNMNEKEHSRRYKFLNPGLLDEIQSQGKNILLLMCHYGNWEWLSILPRYTRMPNLAIYKPLQNKKFDKLFLELRGKYGVIGVSMETTLRHMARYEEKKQPVILFSLADQRPQKKKTRYWARFMNQDSAILAGTEKLCRRFNMAVVFLQVTRLQRGYYHIKFVPVSLDPEKNEEFEITRKYFDLVESLIRKKPEYWLWSHNRWKYSRWPSKDHVDIDQVLSRH